jgi:glucokinase
MNYANDPRLVMTLDAGGTNLAFAAMRGLRPALEGFTLPTQAGNLDRCLATIVEGFTRIRHELPAPPAAISFAFPGPSDYPRGIIGDLQNLPAFRGGVALGPMLADKFGIPTYINNDGDLFTYGEAIAGFLPYVNGLLEQAGSPKRYRNLFGVTLGTGLGGGIVSDGELFVGDNSAGGEIWLLRNKFDQRTNAEDGACIRAVRRVYAQQVGIAFDEAPEPKLIFEIGMGLRPGNQQAAQEAFRRAGEVAGDVIAQAVSLTDGLVVIGGGLAGAHQLFMPALIEEMNGSYVNPKGERFRRLIPKAFNLEDANQREQFLQGDRREIRVPGSERKIAYDPLQRTGVGISRLGTNEAVAIGAYAFALHTLDAPARVS